MNRRRFLAAAGLLAVAGIAGGPVRSTDMERFPSREQWMDRGPLRSMHTEVNGVRIHALVSREAAPAGAEPIVLVHGSGLSGQYMIPTARELARDFPVWVPDLPGYGDSGDPGEVLNVPGLADWLADWMEAVGLARASLLGNSFGCQVIADLAARHPERVARAILQGPTTPPDERSAFWQFVRWRQNQAYNPDWLGDVTNDDYHKAGAWRLLRSFVFQITDRIEAKMPAIRAPVLIIRGEFDPIANQAFCEMLARLAPAGDRVTVVPGVAHTLVFTAPVQVAEATSRFMRKTPAGPLETSGRGAQGAGLV